MRVFILGLLAAVSCVNSHAIRYPHHQQLLAYTPARGEFPVYNDVAQGFVRYFDNNGAEHQLGYTYPEPLYGVRRLSYAFGSDGNQFLRTSGFPEQGFTASSYYQLQDTNELAKAREEHFRRWCEQRYQALKAEMEKLRAEGLQPSSDMMAKLQPLEKIISSTTYSSLSESPEIKRIRDEHLRIWNEARLKVLQQEASHLRFGHQQHAANEMKQSFGSTTSDANANIIIGETAEQKKAREEHLRIYNEQLQQVKQLEAERLRDISTQTQAGFFKPESQAIEQPTSFELKSRFEHHTQQHHTQQPQLLQPGPVQDTPEVMRAREEHLRLVNEAKLRAEASGTFNTNDDGSYKPDKIEASPVLKFVPTVQQPIQPIQNIAILQTSQPTQQAFSHQQQSSFVKMAANDFGQQPAQPTPVQDTPEVIRAREEHFKLFNAAKLQASQPQPQQQYTDMSFQKAEKIDTYAAKPVDDEEKMREMERMREEQRLMEAERMREAERLREEEKMREMERLREMERKKEEERVLEAERLRLKQEEEQRMEEEAYLKKGTFSGTFGSGSAFQGIQQQGGNLKATFESGSSASGSASTFSSGTTTGSAFQGTQPIGENLKTTAGQGFQSGLSGAKIFSTTSGGAIQGIQQQDSNLKTTAAGQGFQGGLSGAKIFSTTSDGAIQGIQQQDSNLKTTAAGQGFQGGLSGANIFSTTSGGAIQGIQQQDSNLKTTAAQGFESGSSGFTSGFSTGGTAGSGFILSSQYKDNPFLIRVGSNTGSTANIIQDQQALKVASPIRSYLPAKADAAGSFNKESPFLTRFSETGLQGQGAQQQQIIGTQAEAEKFSTYSSSSSASQTGGGASSSIKFDYGSNFKAGGLSELEKATRDHFRAHELALEQLRLANLKNPFKKDC